MNAAPKAGRREWIGLAVIALPCLLYSMDLTVLGLAIPRLSEDLEPSSAQLLWIMDIYGFFVAGSLITAGTLGDRIGRRRMLLTGAAFFGITSVLAAFSTSASMLIGTRALLGIAGATVAPSTLSLIRNMFLDPQQRTTAISIWMMSYSLGGAIGPLIGGVLLEYFWWGSVFLIAVPAMALLLIVGPRLLPEYKDPAAGKIDLASAALSLTSVLSMIFGLKLIAQDGFSGIATAAIVAGVAIGVVFVRRQHQLADPLIDLRLFHIPAFRASLVLYGVSILVLFGGFFYLPQYLQLVRGLSPFKAGLWTIPWALAFVVGSLATPALARHVRHDVLMAGGLLLSAFGFLMLMWTSATSGLLLFAAATVVFSLSTSPVFTLTNDVMIGSAPPERAGAASGISETCAEFSGALGIAVFGSIGVALYRSALVDTLPATLPQAVRSEVMATLGGAVVATERLPAETREAVLTAAREAFMRGIHLCAAISVAGAIALAVFAWLKVAPRRSTQETRQATASSS